VDAEALEFAKTRRPDVGSGLVCRCSHALTDPNVLQFITVVVGLTAKQFVGHSAWQNPINHPGPKMTVKTNCSIIFSVLFNFNKICIQVS